MSDRRISALDYECLFRRSPSPILVLDASLEIVEATDAYLQATMTSRESIVGRRFFDVFLGDAGDSTSDGMANLKASIDRVLSSRQADRILAERYKLRRGSGPDGQRQMRPWRLVNTPILDDRGEVALIQHRIEGMGGRVLPDQAADSPVQARRPRILLASDDACLRECIPPLLNDRHEVRAISDGEPSLEFILKDPPDLVVTDVDSPSFDGIRLLRDLRATPATRTLPVILLSERADEEAWLEGLRAGADDCIAGSLNAREIAARIASQVELSRIRDEAKEANQRATRILESITDGFLALDSEWKFTYLNAAAEKCIGMSRESLLGKSHWEVFPETVGTALEREYRRAAAEKVSIEFENLYEPWDRWFQMNLYPSPDGGLSIYFRDETGRKWSERLLAEHAAMLERIASGHPLDECLTEVTAALSRLRRGTRACVLLADADRGAFSASFSSSIPASFGLALNGAPINDQRIGTCGEAVFRGEPVGCSDIERDASWSEPWREHCLNHGILACHSEPVLGADGRPLGSVLLCFDEPRAPTESELRLAAFGSNVTAIAIERECAAAAVISSEARLRRIVEGARDYAIVELDSEGKIVFWNGGAERLLGWTEAEILGQTAAAFFTPEDRERDIPVGELERARTDGGAESERWYARADGSRFWGGGLLMPLSDGGATGRTIGYIKVIQDRTAWRRMEEDLRDQAERLREADRRKDEFLAMLAHELRNPLAAIVNATQLAKISNSPEHRVWSQEVVERQVQNLSRMVDDLLDASRLTRGKIQIHPSRVNISQSINSAVETVQPLVQGKNHRLLVDLDPAPAMVEADLPRLEQVFVNLLNNAVRYTEPGGRITLTTGRDAGEFVAVVEDTGIGMPPDLLSRAFELFVQGDRAMARTEGGLGIGLTVAKRLVELHRGTLTAESEGPGHGCRFTVRLPLSAGADVTRGDVAESRGVAPRNGARVLVVDDNVDSARGMAQLLAIMGYDVRLAHDGETAISEAKARRADIILLDIGLPGMDGYEVARNVRQEGCCRDSTIICVSGYGDATARERGLEAGFDHHLTKPVDHDALWGLLSGGAESRDEHGT